MKSINVAFAIGKEGKEKLKTLSAKERKEYILGRRDKDDFEKQLLGIEELDEHWECILNYFKEKRGIRILENGKDSANPNLSELLILVEEDHLQKVHELLYTWEPLSIARDYLEFIKQNEEIGNFSFYQFVYYIDAIKELSKQALEAKGALLVSLEFL